MNNIHLKRLALKNFSSVIKTALSVSMRMKFEEFTTTIKEARIAAAKMKEYFLEIMVELSD